MTQTETKLTIRTAVEADAEALLAWAKRIFEDGEGQILEANEFQMTVEQERAWIKNLSESGNDIILIAEYAGKIIGMLDAHVGKRKRLAHTAHFGMAVLPEHRSKGVGSALIDQMLVWIRSYDHVEKINLAVLASNARAIALYKKFGFQEEGRRKNEFKLSSREYVDDVLMAKFL